MDKDKKSLSFWQRWMPAVVMCAVTFVVMLVNYFTIDRTSIYTLAMVGGCLLIMPLALMWGRKHPLTLQQVMLNMIVVVSFVLVISFLFMVLPSMIGWRSDVTLQMV